MRRVANSSKRSSFANGDISELSHKNGKKHVTMNRGSIVRIHLKDFMTYKDVELISGPYLNVVLGPNGTGKSAIVCGIILGLGGDATTTGRASHIGDYIRKGCELTVIEIELYNDYGSNNIIRRTIASRFNRGGKEEFHSQFRIDSKECTKKEVTDFMRSLNIRVENLCQFLPQERVIEFVKMDQKTLLENTERAAGDLEMYDNHCLAVNLSKDIQQLMTQHQSLTNFIASESEVQTRAEEELRRIHERDKFKDEIEWLRKKKPWIMFEEKRVEYANAKESLDLKREEYKQKEKSLQPLKKNMENAKNEHQKYQSIVVKSKEKIMVLAKDIDTAKTKVEKAIDKSTDAKEEYNQKVSNEKRRLKKINDIKAELNAIQTSYKSLEEVNVEPEIEKVMHEVNETDSKIKKILQNMRDVRENNEKLTYKRREEMTKKEKFSDMFARSLEKLNELNSDARKAYDWLQRNKSKFSGVIYPPVMTQINLKKREYAKYVESAIPKKDMSLFIFENSDDIELFTKSLKQDLNIRVNVAMAPAEESNHFVPPVNLQNLKEYGVYSYVKDMFTAPDAVMAYLCKSCHVHEIPIGDNSTSNPIVLEKLQEYHNFRQIYSQTHSHNIQISRYDHQSVISTDFIPDAKFLHFVLDQNQLQRIEKTIDDLQNQITVNEQHLQKMVNNERELTLKMKGLDNRKNELYMKKNEKKVLETKIKQKKQEIERNEKECVNLETEKKKVSDFINKNIEEQMTNIHNLQQSIFKCTDNAKDRFKALVNESIARKMRGDLEKAYVAEEETLRDLKNEMKRLAESLQPLKDEAQKLRNIAIEKSGFNYTDMSEELKNKFKELPDTVDEIDAKIVTLKMRIESIVDADDSVKDDYNKRKAEIENRKKTLNAKKKELKEKQLNLETVKKRWIPSLEQLIEKINANFSKFMSSLRCAGEVSLYRGTDPDMSFDEYGITIKVKFRDTEQLKELTSFHQSGGERSVSTMVYMIALQELTKVPFRCVDEINQGMDEANERAIFNLISETSGRNSSQYFLFSPKLLPNLTYTEKMKIHIIFNGPYFNVNWQKIQNEIDDDDDDENEDEDEDEDDE